MANITFGERLRRARIRNAITQVELANKMNTNQATISNWESGKVVPNKEKKEKLKNIVGIGETEKLISPGAELRNNHQERLGHG